MLKWVESGLHIVAMGLTDYIILYKFCKSKLKSELSYMSIRKIICLFQEIRVNPKFHPGTIIICSLFEF